MEFRYTPELLEYMKKKNNTTVLVELVEVNNTDLEVTELHVRLADKRIRELFLGKKRYRSIPTEVGEVLLPPYPLELDEVVTFGLKKVLFVQYLTYKGIKV